MQDDKELELARFGETLLQRHLVPEHHAPFYVRWTRAFLGDPAAADTGRSLDDRRAAFLDRLRREARAKDWQIEQADRAIRLFFHNFRAEPASPLDLL